MNPMLIVARREYLEVMRSRTFFIATVVIPLVFGIIALVGYNAARRANRPHTIEILAQDSRIGDLVVSELSGHASIAPAGATEDKLRSDVTAGRFDGYLILGSGKDVTLVMSAASGLGANNEFSRAISRARIHRALEAGGAAADAITATMAPVTISTRTLRNGVVEAEDTSKRAAGANIMAGLLYFVVVFYGMNAANSVAADKSSRIFEILLASVEPPVLMAGKLFGMAAAGLTQLAIWMAVGSYFALSPLAGFAIDGGLAAYGITPLMLIFAVIYFLTGFLFYSSVGLAVGAAVNDQSELQRFAMLIVMPQAIAMVLLVYVMRNPASRASTALSLFPPFTHVLMMLRLSTGTVPPWQLGLSIVLMVAAIWLLLRVAAKIYRVGILMYGKPPTFPELVRWMRLS